MRAFDWYRPRYLERRNSHYFVFFTEFDRFSGRLYYSGWT